MIKYFCDRCGKEIEPTQNCDPLWTVQGKSVCKDCKDSLDSVIERAKEHWEKHTTW